MTAGANESPGCITVRARGDVLTVRFTGEIDQWLRGQSHDAVAAIWRHDGRVELDLRAVTFFGAEGVRMLLAMHHAGPSGAVRLVGASRAVERTLRICGISPHALPDHRPAL